LRSQSNKNPNAKPPEKRNYNKNKVPINCLVCTDCYIICMVDKTSILNELSEFIKSIFCWNRIMSSNPAHNEVYSIQLYVIKFFSDLWQVGGFLRVLRFPPPINPTAQYNWNIVDRGVKYHTLTLTPKIVFVTYAIHIFHLNIRVNHPLSKYTTLSLRCFDTKYYKWYSSLQYETNALNVTLM